MTERSRTALYQGLSTIVDEDAVEEMMSYFPARDVEEPVTTAHMRAEMADLRTELHVEMAALRTEVKDEINLFRTEVKDEINTCRTEVKDEINTCRTDLTSEINALELRINDRMDDRFRSMYSLTIGTNVATVVAVAMVIFAALRL